MKGGEAALQESAAICESIGHTVGTANACTGLVQVAMQQEDVAAALGYQEKARVLYQQVGDLWGVAIAYNNLGKIHLLAGDLAAACALFSQAVNAYRQANVPGGLANALGNWGEACLQMNDLSGAASYFKEALAIAADIGDWPVALDIVVKTAVLHHQQTGTWAQPLLLLTFALHQPALLAETRRIVEKTLAAWEADASFATRKTAVPQAEQVDWAAIVKIVDLLLKEVSS
jgi:tetratricopeptide (TPR) repeat protein